MTEHIHQYSQWVMSILISAMMGLIYIVYLGISSDIEKQAEKTMAVLTRIELIAIDSVETKTDLIAHIEEARYWKTQITDMRDQVTALREDAGARKDPFTGTEGRYLRERIERLEHLVDDVSREARDHIQKSEKHK
jgi:hypothetical protein